MTIMNTSTEMGTCEWFKPALHYFVILSIYISSCYEVYIYDVGSWDPSNVWKCFLQTKSYIKLIKYRWWKYNAIQIHLSQILHGDEALKSQCVQIISWPYSLTILY